MNAFEILKCKLMSCINVLYTEILKRGGVVIGKGSRVYYKSDLLVKYGSKITIGECCTIGVTRKGYHAGMPFFTTLMADGVNSEIVIGDNCRLNGVYVHAQKKVIVGKNCVMAAGVNIIDSNGHELYSLNRTKGRDEPKEIIIGNNVWIGLNSIILKGTRIGDNSVIAAGSVVKGDFPENSLIQGNPAICVSVLNVE